MTQADDLDRVRHARQALDDAQIARDAAVQLARDGGATIGRIAEAAHLSRPTIYRILDQQGGELPPETQWDQILKDALAMLADMGSPDAASVLSASRRPLDVLARRVRHGMAQTTAPITMEDREQLREALDIVTEIERRVATHEPTRQDGMRA